MRIFRLLTLLAPLCSCLPLPATAQGRGPAICAERADILAQLHSRFGETVRSVGLAGSNRIVEVHASDETGSWTITVTGTNGVTCLLASGGYFEDVLPVIDGDPA